MRSELVDRCVDGALYGSLPRCQDCGGGVLRVRYPSKYGHGGQGAFHCPGYYDGDAFIHCAFSASTVARPKWLETCASVSPASVSPASSSGATSLAVVAPAKPPPAKAPSSKSKKAKVDAKVDAMVGMPGEDD